MIKKSTRIIFEIIAFTIAAILVSAGFLIWTLSQGAINISFVNPYIIEALNKASPVFDVTIKDTTLTWGGYGEPLTLLAHNVKLVNNSGGEITSTKELGISVSLPKLFVGEVLPTHIKIFEPEILVTHTADGKFDINLQTTSAPSEAAESAPTENEKVDILALIMDELKKPMSDERVVGLLKKVSIQNIKVLYRDIANNITIQSPQTDIVLTRDDNGLEGIASIKLMLPKGSETLRGSFYYDRALNNFQLSAALLNIHPEKILDIAPEKLSFLNNVKLPISITLHSGLDAEFIPSYIDLDINTKAGTLNFGNLFLQPLPVQSLDTKIRYQQQTGLIELQSLDAKFDDAQITANGTITLQENTNITIKADAAIMGMPTNELYRYWPESLAPNAREWVIARITDGTVPKATANIDILIPQSDINNLVLNSATGQIDVSDANVNYLPPMPIITHVDAIATYSAKDFAIKLSKGNIDDISLKNGDILISKFDEDVQDMDIAFNAVGPFDAIMKLIDGKPLGFAAKMGMEPDNFTGTADANVTLKFPLLHHLLVDDVQVTVNGTVSDAVAKDIVLHKTLTSPSLKLFVDNKHLKVDGTGEFAKLPATFTWVEQFDLSVSPLRTIDVQTAFPIKNLQNLDITFLEPYTDGLAEAAVSFVSDNPHKSTLSVNADLTQTNINFGPIFYTKPIGTKASVSFTLPLTDYKLASVDGLSYHEGKNMFKGSVLLDENGGFKNITLPQAMIGRNSVSVFVEGNNTQESPLKVHVKGAVLDANPYLSDDTKTQTNNASNKDDDAKTNLLLTFAADKVFLDDKGFWSNAKGLVFMKNSEKERVEIDAHAGNGDIYLRFVPNGTGGYKLRFESIDTGAMMKGLGLTFADVRGGKLVIDGKSDALTPYNLTGTFDASDFTVSDAPLLARLVNAFSLTGVLELLNNDGLVFDAAHGTFTHTKNKILSLKDGAANGNSIGFSFEGDINLNTKNLDINGTIIPAYKINQIMSSIPLVGDILTGTKGEGIVAAKFTVKGERENAEVSVNPLSVLTPGILRSIFFDADEEK